MNNDSVNNLLNQWENDRQDIDLASLGVAVRIQRLADILTSGASRALEPLGLSLWEYDVLSALRRQGRPYQLPATRLAEETRMSSAAMTHRVSRLIERDMVTREASSTDRRAVLVRLTSAGMSILDEAIAVRVAIVADALNALAPRKRTQLDELLGSLLEGVEGSAEEAGLLAATSK